MPETFTKVVDPVCGVAINREAAIVVVHAGAPRYFCDVACAETFRDEPERWLTGRDQAPIGASPLTDRGRRR